MFEIKPIKNGQESAWNSFVEGHSQGTPFHLTNWRDAVTLTFGHDSYYLAAWKDNVVTGVLPLFHVRSLLFGSILASVAFAVYGGVLADDSETAKALENEAMKIANRLNVDYVEFRNRDKGNTAVEEEGGLYFTFRKKMPEKPDEVLQAIPRKTRRMVRLGVKADLKGRLTSKPEDMDSFYHLFSHNLRKLGTPAFPKSLIVNMLSSFGERADILLIEKEGKVVAGVLNFYFRDEVLPYYSGADESFQALGANNFLYYDLMVKSVERGFVQFDFGRSKVNTGPFNFKRHFGFEPEPLCYRQFLVRAKELPSLNPTNPKYHRAIELWKKLPLWATNTVGPWIVRGIP